MTNNDLIKQYQRQEIFTMSNGELLVKLYDELLKNLRYGAALLKEKNVESAKKCTAKSKDIINYLLVILDDHYSIAANLRKIYSTWLGQIVRANAYEDAVHLEKIIPEAQDLRDAWAQAEKATRMQKL